MDTMTVYQHDRNGRKLSAAEYKRRYRIAVNRYGNNKVKIDDGFGGIGWMFFESADDMRTWKQQR